MQKSRRWCVKTHPTKDLTESLNFVNFGLVNNFWQQTSKCGEIKNRLQATGCGLREERGCHVELLTSNGQLPTFLHLTADSFLN
jgi:hypothetical protein